MSESSTTLLARLHTEFPDSSGRRLRAWLVAGRVRVGGEIVRDPRTVVAPGDRVTLGAPPPPALTAALRLVHEDDELLVIEKPPGLLTIGTERERERTAYRMVWAYLKGARPPRRPFIVHRLDRETSGLLVIAKTPEAQGRLQGQFAAGQAERRYVAIVEGVVKADEGMLRDVLVEERSLRVRPADPGRPPPKGRRARIAITWYRVLERRADVTRVALRLGTGRRHQIRVQLAKLGHPVIGDVRHGARRDPIHRLCLHATRLGFHHPDSGASIGFESPPPAEFGGIGRPMERRSAPPSAAPDRGPRPTDGEPRRSALSPSRPGNSTRQRPGLESRGPRPADRDPQRPGSPPWRTGDSTRGRPGPPTRGSRSADRDPARPGSPPWRPGNSTRRPPGPPDRGPRAADSDPRRPNSPPWRPGNSTRRPPGPPGRRPSQPPRHPPR